MLSTHTCMDGSFKNMCIKYVYSFQMLSNGIKATAEMDCKRPINAITSVQYFELSAQSEAFEDTHKIHQH